MTSPVGSGSPVEFPQSPAETSLIQHIDEESIKAAKTLIQLRSVTDTSFTQHLKKVINSGKNTSILEALPPDLISIFLRYLRPNELLAVMKVSQYLRPMALAELISQEAKGSVVFSTRQEFLYELISCKNTTIINPNINFNIFLPQNIILPHQITDEQLKKLFTLGLLANVSKLDLTGCKNLTFKGLSDLEQCKNLKLLDLSWCRLTDDILKVLKKVESLNLLNLTGCLSTVNSVLLLIDLNNLETLVFNGNFIKAHSFETFTNRLNEDKPDVKKVKFTYDPNRTLPPALVAIDHRSQTQ